MAWSYKDTIIRSLEDVPVGAVGFVYLLTNVLTGKKYIGKKLIHSTRKKALTKKEKLEKGGRSKWKIVTTESNWLDYTSSSKEVNEDVKNNVPFAREILEFTFSKTQTTYLEVKLQFVHEVLESDDWYNNNINSRWFRGNIGIE